MYGPVTFFMFSIMAFYETHFYSQLYPIFCGYIFSLNLKQFVFLNVMHSFSVADFCFCRYTKILTFLLLFDMFFLRQISFLLILSGIWRFCEKLYKIYVFQKQANSLCSVILTAQSIHACHSLVWTVYCSHATTYYHIWLSIFSNFFVWWSTQFWFTILLANHHWLIQDTYLEIHIMNLSYVVKVWKRCQWDSIVLKPFINNK